ncbi:MAG: hypothetical protein ACE5FH_01455 [Candidatus Zixiibacteriota bacterium]
MFFIGVVIPTTALFYILSVRPALARLDERTISSNETTVSLLYATAVTVNSKMTELDELFGHVRDSLGRDVRFARNLPDGSVTFLKEADSVAVIFQYNLDCGCPLEKNRYDVLCYSVDFTENIKLGDNIYIEGVPRERFLDGQQVKWLSR